ncbi:MAG TPA: hypothetical protein VFI31_12360 [Pirellulales bacterium]|nr:hypothetical protein [Pirellulales bacterium]
MADKRERPIVWLAEDTDYDNFKSEVARHQGSAGAACESALHRVWSIKSGDESPHSKDNYAAAR